VPDRTSWNARSFYHYRDSRFPATAPSATYLSSAGRHSCMSPKRANFCRSSLCRSTSLVVGASLTAQRLWSFGCTYMGALVLAVQVGEVPTAAWSSFRRPCLECVRDSGPQVWIGLLAGRLQHRLRQLHEHRRIGAWSSRPCSRRVWATQASGVSFVVATTPPGARSRASRP
jgi:hypothetical protein